MKPWAYYLEFDPYAAQWLRNLIAAGHIAPGVVDDRSILDVSPDDLREFNQVHLFAGLGAWSYAARLAGWSDDRSFWTASCPCQPFSVAGVGGGFDDERHLWPYAHYLIEHRHPPVVVGEQVASKVADPWLDLVQDDMEGLGYAFGACAFPSASVGAPHIRDRDYWVAYTTSARPQRGRDSGAAQQGWEGRALERGSQIIGLDDDDDEGLERLGRGYQTPSGRQGTARPATPASESSRLADCTNSGFERRRRPSETSDGRDSPRLESERFCFACGLAHDQGERCRGAGQDCGRPAQRAGDSGQYGGVGDADICAVRGDTRTGDCSQRENWDGVDGDNAGASGSVCHAGPINGHWQAADWLFCRDGKWRPVEPSTFPLAHGAASRVGRLRAYGNAINAQQAKIWFEVIEECMP